MSETAFVSDVKTARFDRITLAPFVAILYAYCAGGPFGFEAMISTAGPGMSLLFILVVPFLFSVPMALATAEMAGMMPVEGGFYRWTRAAFGDFWGFQCGWWNWTGTFLMCAAYGVMLADYVAQMVRLNGTASRWAIAAVFLLLVAWLNVRGIRLVGNLTLVLLLLSLVPVAVFTAMGFWRGEHRPWEPLMPPGQPWHQVYGVGLALALWIYSGYEQLSTVIEEVEAPAHNFPRGLAIVVPLAIVSFLLPIAAGLAALGNWQEWDTGYLVTAATQVGGAWLGRTMFAAAATCTLLLLQSTMLSASRVPFTMSEDGYLPASLAGLNRRFRTPVKAIMISAVLCALLALFRVTQLIAVYAWLRAGCSVLTLLAFWRLRRSGAHLPRIFCVPGGMVGVVAVVLVPVALFAWALVNSDPDARLWGPLYLALGPVAFLLARRAQAAAGIPARSETR
jgi:amino acid transporter